MDNIPTKKELDTKAEEVNSLWLVVLKAKRIAAACEEEFKDMRYRFYLARLEDYEYAIDE